VDFTTLAHYYSFKVGLVVFLLQRESYDGNNRNASILELFQQISYVKNVRRGQTHKSKSMSQLGSIAEEDVQSNVVARLSIVPHILKFLLQLHIFL
jgi:hypothetical protein